MMFELLVVNVTNIELLKNNGQGNVSDLTDDEMFVYKEGGDFHNKIFASKWYLNFCAVDEKWKWHTEYDKRLN